MKQRKKVWVVLGPHGGLWSVESSRMAAQDGADLWESHARSMKVVPAIVEYEIPKKDRERQADEAMAYREKAKALLRGKK